MARSLGLLKHHSQILLRLLLSKVMNLILGFAVTSIVISLLTQDAAGKYFFTISLALVTGHTAFGWLQTIYLRFGVDRNAIVIPEKIAMISQLVAAVLLASAVLWLIVEICLSFSSGLQPLRDYVAPGRIALMVGANVALLGLARVNGSLVFPQVVENVIKPSIMLSLFLGFSAIAAFNLDRAIVVYMFAQIVSALLLLRAAGMGLQAVLQGRLLRSEALLWIKAAPSLVVATFSTMMVNQGDILVVSSLGRPSEVAVYKLAAQIAAICSLGVGLVNYVYAPLIAAAYRRADLRQLKSLIVQTVSLTGFVALLIGSGLVGVGWFTFSQIFGSEYATSYGLMCILVVAKVLDGFFGPITGIAAMTGKQSYTVIAMIVAVAIIWGAGRYLGQIYGAAGVAVGAALAVVAWNSTLATFLWADFRTLGSESRIKDER